MVKNIEMQEDPTKEQIAAQADSQMQDESQPAILEQTATEEEKKQEEPLAVIETTSSVVVPQSTKIRMFERLDSNLCMATILGYLLTWQQTEKFFRCLNTRGQAFFDKQKKQYRYFIDDRPQPPLTIVFGERSAQHLRPEPFARIQSVDLSNVAHDLHKIEEFVTKTMAFGSVAIGSRGFKLFKDAQLEQMVGLQLPFAVQCREQDRANLRTMVSLLQKTRSVQLDLLKRSYVVLKVIGMYPEKFRNIQSLHIEYDDSRHAEIEAIPAEFMAHIRELSLSDQSQGRDHLGYDAAAVSLIRKTSCLQKLSLTPTKRNIDWIALLAENADKLHAINSLTISAEFVDQAQQQAVDREEAPLRAIHGYRATQPGGAAAFFNGNHKYNEGVVVASNREHIKPNWFQIIHREFEKHGTVFREAMPRLNELKVAAGQFSLKTTEMLQPVESLDLSCGFNVGEDMAPEQMARLKYLTLGKTQDHHQLVSLARKFAAEAPNLRRFTMDLYGAQPLRPVETVIREGQSLESLKVTNMSTEIVGIGYLVVLAEVQNLKELDLSFIKLHASDVARIKTDHFPQGANQSVESLKLHFNSSGKTQAISGPQWRSFLAMFAGVKHLEIQSANFAQYAPFLREMIAQMVHLKTLKLPGCEMSPDNMTALFEQLACESCQIEELTFDGHMIKTPILTTKVIKMLEKNKSLKALIILRSVKLPIDVTVPLLQVIGQHQRLQSVFIQGAKLACTTQAQASQLKDVIVSMAQPGTSLRSLVLETNQADQQRMTEEQCTLRASLVKDLGNCLPQMERIRL